MSLVLGLINIAISVAVLLLVGYLVKWFAGWVGLAIPAMIEKLYAIIVFLVALYMLMALLFGLPSMHLVR